jgi:HK97 family phage prohead protease
MEQEIETPLDGRITDGPDDGTIVRTFAAEMSAGDGRTVDVRIVPYGETAIALDGYGGVARGIPYTEQWMPGVFTHQERAANRVLANFEHHSGLAGVVGHGLVLREAPEGFYGSFRMHETPDGDKALMLVKEGVLGGVSLEAQPVKSVRNAAGIVQRVKANLKAIALCREPAYAGAMVLAVRTAPVFDEELLPVEIDPDLLARCERLGIAVPERMKAHPAEGTPAEAGTPEDGTRPTETKPTSEV